MRDWLPEEADNCWGPGDHQLVAAHSRAAARRAPRCVRCADGQSRRLGPLDLIYPHRVGETYGVKYNPAHRWFYIPEMRTDEVLLLKCYDSELDGRARFLPHTAFIDPTTLSHARTARKASSCARWCSTRTRGICGMDEGFVSKALSGMFRARALRAAQSIVRRHRSRFGRHRTYLYRLPNWLPRRQCSTSAPSPTNAGQGSRVPGEAMKERTASRDAQTAIIRRCSLFGGCPGEPLIAAASWRIEPGCRARP